MFHQPDLFGAADTKQNTASASLGLPELIALIAVVSPRPRYTFMVLNLIAKAAGSNSGSAGPYVMTEGNGRTLLRNWLCDSLVPMAGRDARRRSIVSEVTAALAEQQALPDDPSEAAHIVD